MFQISRRGVGVAFCFISTFLFVSRYISAAIFVSNIGVWNPSNFGDSLKGTGNSLVILSLISLMVGIIYLVWAETEKDV